MNQTLRLWTLGLFGAQITCTVAAARHGVEVPDTERPPAGEERTNVPSCKGESVGSVWAARDFCVTRFATDLSRPRHLTVGPNGEVIVATRDGIVALWDQDGDGVAGRDERATIAPAELGIHGIALSPDSRYVYYASDAAVRRVAYDAGAHKASPPEIVIQGIPATITHPYKSLTFDRQGRLYLQVGSRDNLEPGDGAKILRYALPASLPKEGLAYGSGESFATGLRNAEAMAWDQDDRLWVFVNGRDYLHPKDTPDTFYMDHPGDPIVRLSATPGKFYGYPYCWVLGTVAWGDRSDAKSQWSDPDVAAGHDDHWCQDPANVEPAAGSLPAHTAPLAALRYTGTLFPAEYRGNFIVTSHGSWDRQKQQIGRTLLRVVVDGDRVVKVAPFIGERGGDGNLVEGVWSARPVGVTEARDGSLFFSSDSHGDIFHVGYGHAS